MPKSTIAVSLVAVFLLGLLIGGRFDRSAVAGPTDISANGTILLEAGPDNHYATIWTLKAGRIDHGYRYTPTNSVKDGVRELEVEILTPRPIPGSK